MEFAVKAKWLTTAKRDSRLRVRIQSLVVYLRVREGLRADRPWSSLEMSFILGLGYIHISEVHHENKKTGHYKEVLETEII